MHQRAKLVAGAVAISMLSLVPTLGINPSVSGREPEATARPGLTSLPSSPSPSPASYLETGLELVVAPDGSEPFRTVTEAVEAAAEGDTVLIRAGTYSENVLVEKDIVIRGVDRESVVIQPPSGSEACGPTSTSGCALALVGSNASVTGITIQADPAAAGVPVLYVSGGAPFLDRPIIEGDAVITDGSTARLWDADVTGELRATGAGTEPTIEGNSLSVVRVEAGAAPTIYANSLARLRMTDSGGLVRSNFIKGSGQRIAGPDGVGVALRRPREGSVIRGNNINHHRVGLSVTQGTSLAILGNNFEQNRTGVRMDSIGEARIEGNIFCDNHEPFRVRSGPAPKDLVERCAAGG